MSVWGSQGGGGSGGGGVPGEGQTVEQHLVASDPHQDRAYTNAQLVPVNNAIATKAASADLTAHTGNTSNPHATTAAQVGAATPADVAAASTADRARANHTGTQPASTISDFTEAAQDAVAAALAASATATPVYNDTANTLAVNVTDSPTVGGASAAQLRDRATHTGTQAANTISDFAAAADARIAAARGVTVASLVGGVIPSNQLPSYVDDVLEFNGIGAFPVTGESGKIYLDISVAPAAQYRWTGTSYQQLVSSPGSSDAVPEGSTNLYFTAERAQDAVAAALTVSSTVTPTYNDAGNTISLAVTDSPTVGGASPAQLRDRGTHTGTQLASTISDFAATTRAVPLTGLSLASSAVITATDTVLGAFGKLQGQVSALGPSGGLTDGDKGDFTVTGGLARLDPNVVTYSNLQPATGPALLVGSPSTDTALGEVSLGAGLSMSGNVLSSVPSVGSSGPVLYASPTGNDTTGTGTSGAPYTLQGAINRAKLGGKVIMLAGDYVGAYSLAGAHGLTITADATVVSNNLIPAKVRMLNGTALTSGITLVQAKGANPYAVYSVPVPTANAPLTTPVENWFIHYLGIRDNTTRILGAEDQNGVNNGGTPVTTISGTVDTNEQHGLNRGRRYRLPDFCRIWKLSLTRNLSSLADDATRVTAAIAEIAAGGTGNITAGPSPIGGRTAYRYDSARPCWYYDPTGQMLYFAVPENGTPNATGTIDRIEPQAKGEGYLSGGNGTIPVTITGNGTGATAVANIIAGEVQSVTVTAHGSGYTTATATLPTGTSTSAATFNVIFTNHQLYLPNRSASQYNFGGCTGTESVRFIGIDAYFGYSAFDLSRVGYAELVKCRGFGTATAAFRTDMALNVREYFCEWAGAGNDGGGGQSGQTESATGTRCLLEAVHVWAHDNSDDGYSVHNNFDATFDGGLFEYNGDRGLIPAISAHAVASNATARMNGMLFDIKLEADGGQGFGIVTVPTAGDLRGGSYGTTLTLYGCLSDRNRINYGTSQTTQRMELFRCISSNAVDKNGTTTGGQGYYAAAGSTILTRDCSDSNSKVTSAVATAGPYPTGVITNFASTPLVAGAGGSYTDEQAQDAVGSILVDSATIDFTYNDAANSITAVVKPGSITDGLFRPAAAVSVVGNERNSAGSTADIEATSIDTVLMHTRIGDPETPGLDWQKIQSKHIQTHGIDSQALRQSAAYSVMGNPAGLLGDVADIAATASYQALYRDVTGLTFGRLPLASLQDMGSASVGYVMGGAIGVGAPETIAPISASQNYVLRSVGGVVEFGQVTGDMVVPGTLGLELLPDAPTGTVVARLPSAGAGPYVAVSLDDLLALYNGNYRARKAFDYYQTFIQPPATGGGDAMNTVTNNGTVTSASTDFTNRVGIVNCTGTAVGRAGMATTSGALALGGGAWTYETDLAVAALSDSAERTQLVVGFQDVFTGSNQTDGVGFLYDEGGVTTGATGSPNWQCFASANSVRTFVTTPVAVTAGTYVRLRIEVNADASAATFFINDTLVATIVTNIPSGAARATGFGQILHRSVATAAAVRNFLTDWVRVACKYTTAL